MSTTACGHNWKCCCTKYITVPLSYYWRGRGYTGDRPGALCLAWCSNCGIICVQDADTLKVLADLSDTLRIHDGSREFRWSTKADSPVVTEEELKNLLWERITGAVRMPETWDYDQA